MIAFPVLLEPDDNDTLFVTCPFLLEVKSFGATREEALRHAADAIEEALAGRMARWADVDILPDQEVYDRAERDGRLVRPPLQTTMKLLLFLGCKQAGVTRAELARRLGWHREQVDRLFRLDHASRVDQIDAGLRALGQTLDISLAAA